MSIAVLGATYSSDSWGAPRSITPTASGTELWIVTGIGNYTTCSLTIDGNTPDNHTQYGFLAMGWKIVANGSHTVQSSGISVGCVRISGWGTYLDSHVGSGDHYPFENNLTLETKVGGIIVAIGGGLYYASPVNATPESGGTLFQVGNTNKPCDLWAYCGSGCYILTSADSTTDSLAMWFDHGETSWDGAQGIGMSFRPSIANTKSVTGAQTNSGTVKRKTKKVLSGALTSFGELLRSYLAGGIKNFKEVHGDLAMSGDVAVYLGLRFQETVLGAIEFLGSVGKFTRRALSGGFVLGPGGILRLRTRYISEIHAREHVSRVHGSE